MAPQASLVNKLKVQLKLSISRLRMVQQKDSAKAKQQRREMAQLIEVGKVQSARIRVENIIRSDITTELHEILELYCELLLARSQLLEQSPTPSSTSSTTSIPLDPALEEAVRSIIYAAPRIEIKELHAVRGFLVEKFGKDVALASMEGERVAERVVKKLRVETPGGELVDAYLSEIARFYGVPFGPSANTGDNDDDVDEEEEDGDEDDEDDEPSGGLKEEADRRQLEDPLKAAASSGKNKGKDKDSDKTEELAKTNTPKKLGPQSPLRVVPPSPSTDNVAPRLKLPGAGEKAAKGAARSEAAAAPAKKEKKVAKEDGLGKIPDVDELARRFAELKR